MKNWDKLKNAVIVFDDWENTEHDKTWFLIDNISTRGRHQNTSAIVITHLSTHHYFSRTLLNEANYYILFNKTLPRNIKYICISYLGLDKKNCNIIKRLLNQNRWVCINRTEQIIISPNNVQIIKK